MAVGSGSVTIIVSSAIARNFNTKSLIPAPVSIKIKSYSSSRYENACINISCSLGEMFANSTIPDPPESNFIPYFATFPLTQPNAEI